MPSANKVNPCETLSPLEIVSPPFSPSRSFSRPGISFLDLCVVKDLYFAPVLSLSLSLSLARSLARSLAPLSENVSRILRGSRAAVKLGQNRRRRTAAYARALLDCLISRHLDEERVARVRREGTRIAPEKKEPDSLVSRDARARPRHAAEVYIPLAGLVFDRFQGRHARFREKPFRASEGPLSARGRSAPVGPRATCVRALIKASDVTDRY